MADAPGSARFSIVPGFAVPFAEVDLPNSAPLNAQLRALFLQREAEGGRYANPQPTMNILPGMYESQFDLFRWDDAPILKLREFCAAAALKLVGELNGYSQQEMAEIRMQADAWFHVTRKGGMFGLHNHPNASWSGVYCVDNGYGGAEPASGELQFLHPAPTSGMFMDMGVAGMRNPWAIRPVVYRLRPGQLVMFPSWVLHQVLPYLGDGERITVAFNAWFRKSKPEKAPG